MDKTITIERCLGKPKSRIIRIAKHSSYLEAVRVSDRDYTEFKGDPMYFDAYYGPADNYEVIFFILRSPNNESAELWMWGEVQQAVLAFSKRYKFQEPHLIAVNSDKWMYKAPGSYIQTDYYNTQKTGYHFAHNNQPIKLADIWEVGN